MVTITDNGRGPVLEIRREACTPDGRVSFAETQTVPLSGIHTEPMTISALAGWFGVTRATMRSMLAHLPHEKVGGLLRVEAGRMPVNYLAAMLSLVEKTLNPPVNSEQTCKAAPHTVEAIADNGANSPQGMQAGHV